MAYKKRKLMEDNSVSARRNKELIALKNKL